MSKRSAWRKGLRNAQKAANGLFKLYSAETAEGCSVIRWITPEAGEQMVKQYSARRVVNKEGDTVGYQLHRSFTNPQPVMMTAV